MRGILSALLLTATLAWPQQHQLTEVYKNDDFQLTGVTVSKSGRMFVNFPRWSDRYLNAVVEVRKDGSFVPYPDESWNRWDNKPATAGLHFVCVQSVVVDDQDALWIVDPAAPLLTAVVPGGAKLVRVDLATNHVTRVYTFGIDVVKPESYLNDIRIDTQRNFAYLTDSGAGGLVVVDLKSGVAHRALDAHPSSKPEEGIEIQVNGKPVVGADGKPPTFAADGIALSHDGNTLYYQALTGATLYRIKTSALREKPADAANAVEKVTQTFPVDGLWMDAEDRLYLSNINESAVYRLIPGGKPEKLLSDPRLEWPDTFTQGPDGAIYITASHINDGPQFHHGKSTRTKPYAIYQFKP